MKWETESGKCPGPRPPSLVYIGLKTPYFKQVEGKTNTRPLLTTTWASTHIYKRAHTEKTQWEPEPRCRSSPRSRAVATRLKRPCITQSLRSSHTKRTLLSPNKVPLHFKTLFHTNVGTFTENPNAQEPFPFPNKSFDRHQKRISSTYRYYKQHSMFKHKG